MTQLIKGKKSGQFSLLLDKLNRITPTHTQAWNSFEQFPKNCLSNIVIHLNHPKIDKFNDESSIKNSN